MTTNDENTEPSHHHMVMINIHENHQHNTDHLPSITSESTLTSVNSTYPLTFDENKEEEKETMNRPNSQVDIIAEMNNNSIMDEKTDNLNDIPIALRMKYNLKRMFMKKACIPCYGMITDVRRRIPHYINDYTQGFHPTVLASALFMLFSSIFPGLSFGVLLAESTENQLGVMEVLFATSISGIIFSIISGQPLVIVGVTGPICVFCITIFDICKRAEIAFLPWLSIIGFFTGAMCFIFAVLNLSTLVKYVSRFTAEIFGCLIGVIYIVRGIQDIVFYFENLSMDAALLSFIISIGSFYVSYQLHYSTTWNYFPNFIVKILKAYAVAISVGIFTGISHIPVFEKIDTPFLNVPSTFEPTFGERNGSWILDYSTLPLWSIFAAIIPAFILAALIFFDHNISTLLSQKVEFNLKKGTAFHWDLFVCGLNILVCSLVGIPFTHGLIPQAPLHVQSLGKVETKELPNGKKKEVISSVRENRVSNFLHAFVIGVLMMYGQAVLKSIPKGAMTGIFLYMGFTSFDGNQMMDRIKLWFVRSSIRKELHAPYVNTLPIFHNMVFTCIQILFLGIIYAITESPAALSFPILILILVPIRRWIVPFCFTRKQLYYLDNEEDEPDEYEDDGRPQKRVLVDIMNDRLISPVVSFIGKMWKSISGKYKTIKITISQNISLLKMKVNQALKLKGSRFEIQTDLE